MPSKGSEAGQALLPAIRERAIAAEQARRVPAESIAELTAAGVFRMLQPKRYGGDGGAPCDFYEVIRAIAAADGSTGWVSSVVGIHPWQLGLFPDDAQKEVWSED